MASLADHPIMFNTTELYFPSGFEVSRDYVEIVNQSEAGTDIVQITRREKVSVSVNTGCTSDAVVTFETFYAENSFTLKFWSDKANAYEEHTVRMRNFKKKLIKDSQDIAGYNGLWNVSFTLEEF